MAILIFPLVFLCIYFINVLQSHGFSEVNAALIGLIPMWIVLFILAIEPYQAICEWIKKNTNIPSVLIPVCAVIGLLAFVFAGTIVAVLIALGITVVLHFASKLFP